MGLALSGVRVIQLANFVAAPAAARYFADHGADVIIIESAHGDPLRYTGVNEGRPQDMLENTTWEYLNGNKRCISLDMKKPEGKEAFLKLLSAADILITNWREQAFRSKTWSEWKKLLVEGDIPHALAYKRCSRTRRRRPWAVTMTLSV